MIFDDRTLLKLQSLSFIASGIRAGQLKGDRRSPRKGASNEFADYRSYSPGDDLRRVDWRVYARLDRPFVKLFEEEEDLAVHLLVDASESMNWGAGELNKFRFAQKLGAGFGVVALSSGDLLSVSILQADRAVPLTGALRGRRMLPRLFEAIESLNAKGLTDLNQAAQAFCRQPARPGLAVLFSDLFSPAGHEACIHALQKAGHEVLLVQILAPEEIQPSLAGEIQLVDCETSKTVEVSITPGLIQRYRNRLAAWQRDIKAFCTARGVHYFHLTTDQPWDKFILSELRRGGLVR